MPGRMEATFGAFQSRNFTVLWFGTLFAFIAFFMSTVVQGIVAFDLSGNNRAVGFVVFAQGIAQLMLGPFGGAFADRLSKKLVILVCQSVIMTCFFVLAFLVATDAIRVPLLAAGSFVIGSSFSFLGPSRQSFMVELVDTAKRGNAVALSQVAGNASRIIGPLLAAALLAVDRLGTAGAYMAMGVLYVGTVAATISLPRGAPPAGAQGRSVLGDVLVGFAYVRDHPPIRTLILSYVLVIMAGFSYVTVLPGLLENELGRSAGSMTLLLGVSALGGLGASLYVASLADSPRARRVYTVMTLLFGMSLAGSGFAPGFGILLVGMFGIGIGSGGFQTLNGALVSHMTEQAYFGRVISLTFLAFAASSVLAWPIGIFADAAGERATLVIMGASVMAIVAAFSLAAVREKRKEEGENETGAGPSGEHA